MKKGKIQFAGDIVYILLLFLITEFFNFSVLKIPMPWLLFIGAVGLVILEIWFLRTFLLYSQKKISKYSDVVMKISLKQRLFEYFILPSIFFISILLFLYFNRNIALGHTVLIICISLLLLLFLNVKSSLNKYYSIAFATRAIYDFVCITILYLLLNSYLRIGYSLLEFALLSFGSSLILLLSILKLHNKIGGVECITAIVSAVLVPLSMVLFWDSNIFIIPTIGSLIFYLIVSFWNIRFAGKTKLSEYLYPILYVILAIILLFTV